MRTHVERKDIKVVMALGFHLYIKVVMALGFHLYPSRTEKLSPITPMVLRNSGRVGSRRFREKRAVPEEGTALFVCIHVE